MHAPTQMEVLHVQVLTAAGAPLVDAPARLSSTSTQANIRGDELAGLAQSMRMLAKELGAGDFLSMRLDRSAAMPGASSLSGGAGTGAAPAGEAARHGAAGGGIATGAVAAVGTAIDVFFMPAAEGFAALLVLALPAAAAAGAGGTGAAGAVPAPPSIVSAALSAIADAFRMHGLADLEAIAALPPKQQPQLARQKRDALTTRVLPSLGELLHARAGLVVEFQDVSEPESDDA